MQISFTSIGGPSGQLRLPQELSSAQLSPVLQILSQKIFVTAWRPPTPLTASDDLVYTV